MDTTSALMARDVMPISAVIRNNTVIPVAFLFGFTESIGLDQHFGQVFQESCNVDLSQYFVLCDQGSAFAKGCNQNGNRPFLCRHHFLCTLRDPNFGM
jgi:hypothetical protein